MKTEWIKVKGIIKPGHQVASGKSPNNPYPRGTIEMQTPHFKALGLDLSPYYQGTLNISISPYIFKVNQPEYTFPNLKWIPEYPPETFSFSKCRLFFKERVYHSLVYYPHPETKIDHFQDKSIMEILSPFIPEINYGDSIELALNPKEILVVEAN